jgi:hypothetical protein
MLTDRKREKQLLVTSILRKAKNLILRAVENLNSPHILFYGENSWTVALRQMKFCTLKDDTHTYKFI